MRKLVKLAFLMVLLVPAAASAQLSLGARLGYGLPFGDAEKGGSLKDGIKGQIPLQLEAGFKILPQLTLGGYFSGAYGVIGDQFKDECDTSGIDCSARLWRVGAQALYSLAGADTSFAPWIGAGIGYEWANIKVEGGGFTGETGYSGFEFLNLQAGADWKSAGNLSFGPFVMFSLGQFSKYTLEGTGFPKEDGDIQDKAMHQWLTIGFKGTLDI